LRDIDYNINLAEVFMSRKYTEEFKQEAVKLVTDHGYSQAEAGRRLGISEKNINRWVLASKGASLVEVPIDQQSEQEELSDYAKKMIA
jgi:transposase